MPELAGPLVEAYCADVPDACTDGKVNMELQYSGPSVTQTRIADVLDPGWEPFFNVTIQELLQDAHILEVATGQYQVVTWRQFGSVDPDNEVVWLECATAEGFISLNWVKWCNPDRDALLYEQRATDDLDRRVEIWKEIQAEMNASYAYIFTTHTNWTIGHSDRVRNLCGQTAPDGQVLFCNNQGNHYFHQLWLAASETGSSPGISPATIPQHREHRLKRDASTTSEHSARPCGPSHIDWPSRPALTYLGEFNDIAFCPNDVGEAACSPACALALRRGLRRRL